MNIQRYALISVFDKTGIVELTKAFVRLGYKIISTGGTAKILEANKIPVIPIQKITGNPESFDGRMKTISFQIESGILFDRSIPSHAQQAKELNIMPIDVVVCNLYPFEKKQTIENIDVGGSTMIRAGAKNFKNVLVMIDPADYQIVINNIQKNQITSSFRKKLAAKAFMHLSYYDAQIGRYFEDEKFPNEFVIPGKKSLNLRYGENPHQQAALYFEPNTPSPLKKLTKQWGRDLSLINVTDVNAGIESVRIFSQQAAVVIKHNSPCGIALGDTISQALERAIEADPQSAFGGVIVLNKDIDFKAAQVITSFKDERKGNIDIIVAPDIKKKAFDFLKKVRKTMGIYTFGKLLSYKRMNFKFIDGGFILQDSDDDIEDSFSNWKVVTKVKPTKKQLSQMQIAWKFISRIKSNTVAVIDKDLPMTRGIGSGQTSRVGAVKIALEQAKNYTEGAVLASDSFFPFDDSVKLAAKYGIGAIVQQGGSVRDVDSIAVCNKAGIPMIFTNRRAFWH